MNGYAYQTYGELRYWHPLLVPGSTVARDNQTVFDAASGMIGDVPRIQIDYATSGTIPPVSGVVATPGFVPTTVAGQGIPLLQAGTYTPTPPTPADEITEWTTTGDNVVDYEPSESGYFVEVRNAAFTLLAELPDFLDGKVSTELGKPSSVEILLAGTDTAIEHITKDNFLVIRNARSVIIDQFVIQSIEKIREGDAIYLRVKGQSQAVLLEREAIVEYTTPVTETQNADGTPAYSYTYKTVAEVLQDLLDFQAVERITIADIDADIAASNVIWSCADVSILGGITELQKHLPLTMRGHIWVDWEGGLHWIKQTAGVIAETFQVGEHITSNNYSVDYSNLITRVIMRGWQDIDGTRVALESPGYIDRNVETYGVYSISKTDNRIKYPDSLVAFANRILDEYSVPRVVFDADIINGRIGTKDARDITLATQYQIVDTPQGIDVTVTVVGIDYNLNDPLDVRLNISNRAENLSDFFSDLYSQINEEPRDYTDPDRLRPTIETIFEELVTDPAETWNEDLIDTLEEVLEQTAGGARIALVVSLNADGDHINVKFYDFSATPPGWETAITSILRPYDLQAGFWQSQTLTMTDGRQIAYDATGLDKDYQRHAVCTDVGFAFDVIEEIQPAYFVNGYLIVYTDPFGDLMDYNVAGRTFTPNIASIIASVISELEASPEAYLPFSTTVETLESGDESVGVADTVSRGDHKHGLPDNVLTQPELVAVLPAIPTTGYLAVIWGDSTAISGGTGDNGIWEANEFQDRFYPRNSYTNLSGVPV